MAAPQRQHKANAPRVTQRAAGYTLIELTLAMAVLALLAGALLGAAGSVRGDERLEEGAERLATLMRMLRAEAASEGRRFRLVLRGPEESGAGVQGGGPGGGTGGSASGSEAPPAPIEVEWEPQPLAQAGEFLPYSQRLWARQPWWELVRVERSERLGDSAYSLLSYSSKSGGGGASGGGERPFGMMRDEDPSYASITFNPDGSSDSARLLLRSTEPSDDRSALIELDGVTAAVSLRLMTPTERAEWEESPGSP